MEICRRDDAVSAPTGTRTSALALSILAGCVRRGGPTPSEYPQLSAALSVLSIDKVAPERVAEVLAPTLSPDYLHGWAYLRPHGRPGDHVIVDRLLAREVSRDSRVAAWDEFCQGQAAARAIRNRAIYFHELLEHLETRQPLGAPVLVAGCGAGREVRDYLVAHPESRLQITCADGNAPAAALTEERCRGLRQPVTVVPQEAASLKARSRYALVWAPAHGCCLDDRTWVTLASHLYDLVAPGGELVLGNIAAANPSRAYLEVVARWFLVHRTAEELAELAHATAGRDAVVRVEREPEGAYLFTRVLARV